jgi:nitroreductase
VTEPNPSLAPDTVGLLEGLATTRAIRRYTDDPVPNDVLRDIMFAATRAPSGSNRQPFRFLVFTDSDRSRHVKQIVARGAQAIWGGKRTNDGYEQGSGTVADSPKARMAATMDEYIDNFEKVPALILPVLVRYRAAMHIEGASIYPACQNILLAARALGYGGVLTAFHGPVNDELVDFLDLPENAAIMATISIGKPRGGHGAVRRAPMSDLVFGDTWGESAAWAIDPPGTQFTSRMKEDGWKR